MSTSPINLSNNQLQIVLDILQKHLDEHARVWVFGSRAKGIAKKFSDLDIAIDAGKALSFDQLVDLENAFVESDLAYKVDVVDLQNVKDSIFKKIIEEQAVELDWKLTAR
jgi:type I restriction enzyme S subunit